MRRRLSITTRKGWRAVLLPGRRIFNSGSSLRTVPIPTITASTRVRRRWTCLRDAPLEIHRESPDRVAAFPSRLTAAFRITQGIRVVMLLPKAAFNS
jgi:hypothetical protein